MRNVFQGKHSAGGWIALRNIVQRLFVRIILFVKNRFRVDHCNPKSSTYQNCARPVMDSKLGVDCHKIVSGTIVGGRSIRNKVMLRLVLFT